MKLTYEEHESDESNSSSEEEVGLRYPKMPPPIPVQPKVQINLTALFTLQEESIPATTISSSPLPVVPKPVKVKKPKEPPVIGPDGQPIKRKRGRPKKEVKRKITCP